MVIDTSAVIAILFGEPEDRSFAAAIVQDPVKIMSASSLLEASFVVTRERDGIRELDALLSRLSVQIEPFTREQAIIARECFLKFGKGRHPAGLNFGDCQSYALSKVTGQPLLFKGGDFSQTDIIPAVIAP